MYQYWLFAFKTAKHWGRGPQDWTASILGFDDYNPRTTVLSSSPNSPAASIGTPASQRAPRIDEMSNPPLISTVKMPSSLCFWSIHCTRELFDALRPPPHSPTENLDLNDERSWPTWPDSRDLYEYTEKLSDGLESNDFSNVKREDLPIAVDQIARATRCSPDALLEEALSFSIKSRNIELMQDLLSQIGDRIDVVGLYPFHLAVSYLDGSKQCCTILDGLMAMCMTSLRKLYTNDLGHTILDQLMITILKAHTSCLPSVVDASFKNRNRFEGEDVDICGRWDADSDCIRTLLVNGTSGIPFEWKHMFCHTSVQAICHCIGTVFGPFFRPDINAPSGLFVRRCSQCGLKLQLLPLHALILISLHLSCSGCKNETLFGILACLLCLLSHGANPLLKANISVQALLGNEEVDECSHEELDPVELAEMVPARLKAMWSRDLSTGWEVICHVLRCSQAEWNVRASKRRYTSSGSEHDDDFDMFIRYDEDETSTDEEASNEHHLPANCPGNTLHKNFFGRNKVLASLWAAVQTELLTYRRLEEGDEWISQNFNMHTLNKGLISRGKVDIALVQEEMMNPFCGCGKFPGAVPECPVEDDAVAYYFSDLYNANRAFLLQPLEWRLGLLKIWYSDPLFRGTDS